MKNADTPPLKSRLLPIGRHDGVMPAGHHLHRSPDRSKPVMFRLSVEDRDLLRERAKGRGLSVQAYLEMVALDRPDARNRRPGPTNAGQGTLDVAI